MKELSNIEIKQIIVYSPIAKGGQKLVALDARGVVCIYDETTKEWVATNQVIKETNQSKD